MPTSFLGGVLQAALLGAKDDVIGRVAESVRRSLKHLNLSTSLPII